MKLADNIYVIGGGTLGYGISSPYDCNVYAIDGKDGVILIDAGSGLGENDLLNRLSEAGLAADRIMALILTHAHADHAGGAYGLKSRLGLPVLASELTASIVESADEERLSLPQARKAGTYPEWYRFPPCQIDRILRENDIVDNGTFRFRVVPAPGHSSDMISLYDFDSRTLFSGDVIFESGKLAVIATEDFSMEKYRSTIQRFTEIEVNRLFPGHGAAVLEKAGDAIRKAHRRFELGNEPESIV